jgi:hypothetical protein
MIYTNEGSMMLGSDCIKEEQKNVLLLKKIYNFYLSLLSSYVTIY